jgi:uncharacterized protein YegL
MGDYFVEMTGDDSKDGKSLATAWKTVKHAVETAAADSTINIGKGKFRDALEIKKNLLLRGQGKLETTIQCPEDLKSVPDYIKYDSPLPGLGVEDNLKTLPMIQLIGAVKVRFESLHVLGDKSGFGTFHSLGIVASGKGAQLEIENCQVMDFGYVHIFVNDGKFVFSNSRSGCEDGTPTAILSDVGILVANKTKATITNADLGHLSDHCIDIWQDAVVEVTHCKVYGSVTSNTTGIRTHDKARALIAYNEIIGQPPGGSVDDSQAGIWITGYSYADIHDNTITGFARGLSFNCFTPSRIWANTITNNTRYAISHFVLFGAADEDQPDFGGGYQGSPGENTIHNNGSETGFDVELKSKDVSRTVFARYNDWGTTNPSEIEARIKYPDPENPQVTFDFLPLKQASAPVPIDSILLLDQSGSMLEEGKWESAKSGCNLFAEALSSINCAMDEVKLGLVTFAGTETEDTHIWKPLAALPANPAQFASGLSTPKAPWTTPMGAGLLSAGNQLEPLSGDRRKYIFLLSDGKANSGASPDLVIPEFEHLINIYCVGFGDDTIEPEMLSKISNVTLGDYYLTGTTDPLDLQRFFLNSLATPLGISLVINTREKGVTTFPINEGESKMLVMVGWEQPASPVTFDLRDPTGKTISSNALPAGITYHAEADASFASYTVNHPVAGEWKLLNVRLLNGGPEPEAVRFVALDPSIVAQFWVDRGPGFTDKKLRLFARLMEGGEPLDKVEVKIKVTSPQKSIGTLVVNHLASHSNLIAELTRRLPAGRTLQRSDVLRDYKQRNKFRMLPTEEKHYEFGRCQHPLDKGRAMGIFQTDFTPAEEGTYTFEFVAKGRTRSGMQFRRTYTVSKYVSFMADPKRTRVILKAIDTPALKRQGLNQYQLTVIPVSQSGGLMGPFASDRLGLVGTKDFVPGQIQDAIDGSYWIDMVLKQNELLDQFSLRIGDVALPVASGLSRHRSWLSRLWSFFSR